MGTGYSALAGPPQHARNFMNTQIAHRAEVPYDMGNRRFDQIAAELFPDYSRSRLQQWIKDGKLTADEKQLRGRDKLVGGETLTLEAELEAEGTWRSEEHTSELQSRPHLVCRLLL